MMMMMIMMHRQSCLEELQYFSAHTNRIAIVPEEVTSGLVVVIRCHNQSKVILPTVK